MEYPKVSPTKRPLWSWILLYVLIGSLIYAGFTYTSSKQNPSTTPTNTESSTPAENINIVVNNDGFDPRIVEIKPGQSITWSNQSDATISIASDPHPTHTDYPPLNLGAIKTGESKSLAFPTIGDFKYHNHLSPSQRGTVTVQ